MQEIQKIFEKAYQKEIEKDADTFVKNVLFRYPKARNFTASDILHDMHADHTRLVEYVPNVVRKLVKKEVVIDHPTGPKKIVVKDKGQYGRTGRPQNLYKFTEAV